MEHQSKQPCTRRLVGIAVRLPRSQDFSGGMVGFGCVSVCTSAFGFRVLQSLRVGTTTQPSRLVRRLAGRHSRLADAVLRYERLDSSESDILEFLRGGTIRLVVIFCVPRIIDAILRGDRDTGISV